MGDIVMHNVVSVDGFIADENDEIGPLDWYFNGEPVRPTVAILCILEASAASPPGLGKTSGPWSHAISSTSERLGRRPP
jgi:hypothetical protein